MTRKLLRRPLLFLLTPLFLQAAFAETLPDTRRSAKVHWVIDGDTFELEGGERVRLIGVDAPEYQPWKGKVHPYGREAAALAKSLLARRSVFLETDVQRKDKYGRTLAYVYLQDGEFLNERLALEGLVRVKRYPPNLRRQEALKNAQNSAKKEKKGIWSARSALLN